MPNEIPNGLCQCGCGQQTNIVAKTCTTRNRFKGQPYPFVKGHSSRKTNRGRGSTHLLCGNCKIVKSVDHFYFRPDQQLYNYLCISCRAAAQRRRALKRRYNLTPTEVELLVDRQQNLCAICSVSFDETTMNIDHNHKTGEIRGLLCNSCNMALGSFRDDIQLLHNAVMYLSPAKEREHAT